MTFKAIHRIILMVSQGPLFRLVSVVTSQMCPEAIGMKTKLNIKRHQKTTEVFHKHLIDFDKDIKLKFKKSPFAVTTILNVMGTFKRYELLQVLPHCFTFFSRLIFSV